MHGIIEIVFPKGKNTSHPGNATFSSPSQTIGAIIRGYKGSTTKQIKILSAEKDKEDESGEGKGELQFAPMKDPTTPIIPIKPEDKVWQRDYYEHIIRDERAYRNIANYIRTGVRHICKREICPRMSNANSGVSHLLRGRCRNSQSLIRQGKMHFCRTPIRTNLLRWKEGKFFRR